MHTAEAASSSQGRTQANAVKAPNASALSEPLQRRWRGEKAPVNMLSDAELKL